MDSVRVRNHFYRMSYSLKSNSCRFPFCVLLSTLFLTYAMSADTQSADQSDLHGTLTALDSVYESGFTVTGTGLGHMTNDPRLPPVEIKWKLSMADGKVAYEETVTGVVPWETVIGSDKAIPETTDEDRAKIGMVFGRITYVCPEFQATYDFLGEPPPVGSVPSWPEDGSIPAASGMLIFAKRPDDPTYLGSIKRGLWSIGRGYAKYIDSIEDISVQPNGMIALSAQGTWYEGSAPVEWELIVDPSAGYMVRSAKQYRGDELEPAIEITNSGAKWFGSRCVPENCELIDNRGGLAMRLPQVVSAASSEPDNTFLQRCEAAMGPPWSLRTAVFDHRTTPVTGLQFREGEMLSGKPSSSVVDETIGDIANGLLAASSPPPKKGQKLGAESIQAQHGLSSTTVVEESSEFGNSNSGDTTLNSPSLSAAHAPAGSLLLLGDAIEKSFPFQEQLIARDGRRGIDLIV